MTIVKTAARAAVKRALLSNPWVAPVVAAVGLMSVIAVVALGVTLGSATLTPAAQACTGSPAGAPTAGPTGAGAPGHFAKPLVMRPGRSYQVGATEYTGSYGAIGIPGQDYLPAHPNTYAELSTLDSNPSPNFTFDDADALDRQPYMTGLRVATATGSMVLYKRDVGYGQGPGNTIANGQPYRLDIYMPSAQRLGVTKSPVTISLAATPGAGNALGGTQGPIAQPSSFAPIATCADAFGGLNLPPGVYANPLVRSSNIQQQRIDMGVDYDATGPISAIGDARVTYAVGFDAGWSGGSVDGFSCAGGHAGAVEYQLTDGPDQGRYVYVTEGITPSVRQGQQVRAGQPVARFTGCIEIGWASGPTGASPMAAQLGQQCTTGDPGCHSTYCGKTMSDLIQALGGPPGIDVDGVTGRSC